MSKLFFMDNDLKRIKERIGHNNTKGNAVKVLFSKREVPDEISEYVYGQQAVRYKDYDPWGNGLNANRRAHYDAHLKIGNISCTMTMQELVNLVDRLSEIAQRQNSVIANMNGSDL